MSPRLEVLSGVAVNYREADFGDHRIRIEVPEYHPQLSPLIESTLARQPGADKAALAITATFIDEEGADSFPAILQCWLQTQNERGAEFLAPRGAIVLDLADDRHFQRGKRFLRRYAQANDLAYQDPADPAARVWTAAEREALEPGQSLAAFRTELASATAVELVFHGYSEHQLNQAPRLIPSWTWSAELVSEFFHTTRTPWKADSLARNDVHPGSVTRWIRAWLTLADGSQREFRLVQSKLLMWRDQDWFLLPLESSSLEQHLLALGRRFSS